MALGTRMGFAILGVFSIYFTIIGVENILYQTEALYVEARKVKVSLYINISFDLGSVYPGPEISARTKTCTVPPCVYTEPAELDEFLNG